MLWQPISRGFPEILPEDLTHLPYKEARDVLERRVLETAIIAWNRRLTDSPNHT